MNRVTVDSCEETGSRDPSSLGVTNRDTINSIASQLQTLAKLHITSLGPIVTGASIDPVVTPPALTVKKPWIDEPDGSASFDFQNGVALPAAGAPAVAVLQFTVPDGNDGVIKWWGWNFTGGGFTQFSGDLVVQLLRNGAAIRNYEHITNEKGSIQFPRQISPIRIFANQVITITIQNFNNLLVGNVIGTLTGYFYPNRG
jgi:hypothetical protein